MALLLLIVVGVVALAVVAAVVVVVVVLSVRARPGGVTNPNNAPAVQAGHAHPERTNVHHNFGDTGPNI